MTRPLVCFVDDNEAEHYLLTSALENVDLNVDAEHYLNAEHFLDTLDRGETTLDLLVTDLNMPGMTGFDLIERLRAQERWRSLPILVLSSSGADIDRTRAQTAGADAYFVKPLSAGELGQQLIRMLTFAAGPSRSRPPARQ